MALQPLQTFLPWRHRWRALSMPATVRAQAQAQALAGEDSRQRRAAGPAGGQQQQQQQQRHPAIAGGAAEWRDPATVARERDRSLGSALSAATERARHECPCVFGRAPYDVVRGLLALLGRRDETRGGAASVFTGVEPQMALLRAVLVVVQSAGLQRDALALSAGGGGGLAAAGSGPGGGGGGPDEGQQQQQQQQPAMGSQAAVAGAGGGAAGAAAAAAAGAAGAAAAGASGGADEIRAGLVSLQAQALHSVGTLWEALRRQEAAAAAAGSFESSAGIAEDGAAFGRLLSSLLSVVTALLDAFGYGIGGDGYAGGSEAAAAFGAVVWPLLRSATSTRWALTAGGGAGAPWMTEALGLWLVAVRTASASDGADAGQWGLGPQSPLAELLSTNLGGLLAEQETAVRALTVLEVYALRVGLPFIQVRLLAAC